MPYELHNLLTTPEDDKVLYRYMDLVEFIFMLRHKSLYFSSLESLLKSDVQEGKMLDRLMENRIPEKYKDTVFNMKYGCQFVCCFSGTESESYPMWKAYTSQQDGICIRTSVGRVKKALKEWEDRVYIAKVEYSNLSYSDKCHDDAAGKLKSYCDGHIGNKISGRNILLEATYKRLEFKDENEVRVITLNPFTRFKIGASEDTLVPIDERSYEDGLLVNIDINALIENVIISPFSDKWILELIKNIASDYGCEASVSHSSLAASNKFLEFA